MKPADEESPLVGDDVRSERLLAPRLLALFLGGCLIFGYPILELFSKPATVLGVPLLFVYLFTAWAIFIALIAWTVEGGGKM